MVARTVLVGVLLGLSWAIVLVAGGTQTAFPHVFYLPVLVAALTGGPVGGLVAASVATLLCGPAMPLDAAASTPQDPANWLIRGGCFLLAGGIVGTSTVSLRRGFEDELSARLADELEQVLADRSTEETRDWEQRIRATMQVSDYRILFQPIVRLEDGRTIAMEALSRFGDDADASPEGWFRRAADLGIGVELELAVVAAALTRSAGLPAGIALSVNASPALIMDPRFVALVARHPERELIVEVTEHAVVDDYTRLNDAVDRLRTLDVRLAVDDAGAGFASLRHVVRLQPDLIKLDVSLTRGLRDDPVRRPLAVSLLQFAQRTGSRLIAEGIDTAGDLATWRDLGAHAAQGYHLGPPEPLPSDLASLLRPWGGNA